MKKLLPVLLALLGLGGGVAAGHFLKPAPEKPAAEAEDAHATDAKEADPHAEADPKADAHADDHADPAHAPGEDDAHAPESPWEYVKLDSQFVVPVMGEARVASLIVLSISLEVTQGTSAEVYSREPKLRDSFLRVLFEHERAGGFAGVFTDQRVLGELRANLRAAARAVLGKLANDVLVTDILRQDL